jgi:hypothetical protein
MKLRQPYDSLAKDGGRLGHESEVPEVLAYVCYRKTGQHLLAVSLQLKKHRIHQLIVIGLIAHTSDSTAARQDQVDADLLAFIKAHQSSFNPIARMTGAQRAISS